MIDPTLKVVNFPGNVGRPLDGGGSGPHDPHMEARIAKLEETMSVVRERLATIENQLKHVATKTWVLGGVVAVMATVIGAAWWMAQQYLGPILRGLGH